MPSSLDSLDGMPLKTKVALAGGLVAILCFTIGAWLWLAKESYAVLFTDLEPRDAAVVVAELEKLKIGYELALEGREIRVPEPAVHEARLKLMGSGVPLAGGVGFEIFDNAEFGMTEFAQRINYQRALEGELMRTITSLDEVKYARVHLVMPERGLFERNDKSPSASVTLFLRAARQPAEQQIIGIQRLVAAAVPALTPESVTVTDQNGVTLSRVGGSSEASQLVGVKLQHKQEIEAYLTRKVDEVLGRSLGNHRVAVSIDVAIDFTEVRRSREAVLAEEGEGAAVIRRRETSVAGDAAGSRGTTTTDVEYALGKSMEQVLEHPGTIERLNVGILVPPEMPLAERSAIGELVALAVGLNTARGDGIGVYAIDAVPVSVPPAPPLAEPQVSIVEMAPSQTLELAGWNVLEISPARIAMGAGAIVLFLIGYAWHLHRKRAEAAVTVLTLDQRQQTLRLVRRWLAEGRTLEDEDIYERR